MTPAAYEAAVLHAIALASVAAIVTALVCLLAWQWNTAPRGPRRGRIQVSLDAFGIGTVFIDGVNMSGVLRGIEYFSHVNGQNEVVLYAVAEHIEINSEPERVLKVVDTLYDAREER